MGFCVVSERELDWSWVCSVDIWIVLGWECGWVSVRIGWWFHNEWKTRNLNNLLCQATIEPIDVILGYFFFRPKMLFLNEFQ